jgi:NADPH:quinone reductase-like Zn-dependent oxidoreductase
MRALQFTASGGPEVLTWADAPVPHAGPGQIRIAVRAAAKPPSIDWAVAAAAGVAGETSERGLRLLGVQAGDTIFIDGGSGGVGAVAVQMAVARGPG